MKVLFLVAIIAICLMTFAPATEGTNYLGRVSALQKLSLLYIEMLVIGLCNFNFLLLLICIIK